MGDSLPRTPLNHYAKFDVASFILAREIRYGTQLQNYKQANKQTVNDISTPCLSACVDNEYSPTPMRSPHAGGKMKVMIDRTEKTQHGMTKLMM